jgi:hypothetical protein
VISYIDGRMIFAYLYIDIDAHNVVNDEVCKDGFLPFLKVFTLNNNRIFFVIPFSKQYLHLQIKLN